MNSELPLPDVFGKTNFLVFYNDDVYELSESKQKNFVKIYGKKFGLKKLNWDRVMKSYFRENKKEFRKFEKEFIESELKDLVAESKEDAIEQIIESHPDKRKYNNFLFVDNKIYEVITVEEFISKFSGHFYSDFYSKLEKKLSYLNPRELSQHLRENKDKYHREELDKICDKIWTNDRTVQMFIDNKYLTHLFDDEGGAFIESYKDWIELKLKVQAVKKRRWKK